MERGTDQESDAAGERREPVGNEGLRGTRLVVGISVAAIGVILAIVGLSNTLGLCIPPSLTTLSTCRPLLVADWAQIGFPAVGGLMLLGGATTAARSVSG